MNQHNKPTILTNRQVGQIGNLVKQKRLACSFTILTFCGVKSTVIVIEVYDMALESYFQRNKIKLQNI